MDIIFISIILIGIVLLPVYFIWAILQIIKRGKKAYFQDRQMFNTGRILVFVGIIGIFIIHRYARTVNYSGKLYIEVIMMALFSFSFIAGSRIYALSFRIKEENKGTFHYSFDQWLEKKYRKYLEPLWK